MSDLDQSQDIYQREAQRNEEIRRQQQLRTIEFGQQVQKFLDGPIGQRILGDAEAELKDIANDLFIAKELDLIRQLQARAAVLRNWQDAFAQYIIDGRNAEKEMAGDEAID